MFSCNCELHDEGAVFARQMVKDLSRHVAFPEEQQYHLRKLQVMEATRPQQLTQAFELAIDAHLADLVNLHATECWRSKPSRT